MIPASATFAAAITQPHTAVCRVEVWRAGVLEVDDLPIAAGALSVTASSTVRYLFGCTVSDPSLIPTGDNSLLVPLDTSLRVYRGIRYPDGSTEELLLATVWLDEVQITRPDLTLRVVAGSKSLRVTQAGFLKGHHHPKTSRVNTEIPNIIGEALGVTPTLITDDADPWPLVRDKTIYDGAEDPWALVEQLADLGGGECFYDRQDRLYLRRTPTLAATPAVTFKPGFDGTIVKSVSTISRVGGANGARVVFPSADPKHRDKVAVVVHDKNGTSASRWDGPMGRMLLVETRPDSMADQAVADKAAEALLRRRLGLTRSVDPIEISPDPRVEPGDTIGIEFLSGSAERHVVQSVNIPMTIDGTMRITTRSAAVVPT